MLPLVLTRKIFAAVTLGAPVLAAVAPAQAFTDNSDVSATPFADPARFQKIADGLPALGYQDDTSAFSKSWRALPKASARPARTATAIPRWVSRPESGRLTIFVMRLPPGWRMKGSRCCRLMAGTDRSQRRYGGQLQRQRGFAADAMGRSLITSRSASWACTRPMTGWWAMPGWDSAGWPATGCWAITASLIGCLTAACSALRWAPRLERLPALIRQLLHAAVRLAQSQPVPAAAAGARV